MRNKDIVEVVDLDNLAGITDTVYVKRFEAGTVNVPGHSGKVGGNYGVPHAAFVPTGIDVSE